MSSSFQGGENNASAANEKQFADEPPAGSSVRARASRARMGGRGRGNKRLSSVRPDRRLRHEPVGPRQCFRADRDQRFSTDLRHERDRWLPAFRVDAHSERSLCRRRQPLQQRPDVGGAARQTARLIVERKAGVRAIDRRFIQLRGGRFEGARRRGGRGFTLAAGQQLPARRPRAGVAARALRH